MIGGELAERPGDVAGVVERRLELGALRLLLVGCFAALGAEAERANDGLEAVGGLGDDLGDDELRLAVSDLDLGAERERVGALLFRQEVDRALDRKSVV